MIKEQFPTSFDVTQTVTYYTTSFDALRRFTQSMGLFCIGRGRTDIAAMISNLLLSHDDYIQLRKIAQGSEAATSISGFTLRHQLHAANSETLFQDIIELKNSLDQSRPGLVKRGAPIPKLSTPTISDSGDLHVRFEYQRAVPGRVELMQRVDTEVDFVLTQISQTQWRAVCFPQANQDVKQIEDLMRKMAGRAYETYPISLEGFSHAMRIEFFDAVLAEYTNNDEWSFEQATEITIQAPGDGDKGEYLVLGEDDSEVFEVVDGQEIDRQDLLSINQAILQGRNLRSNSFVKDCERQGFYFLSMTLELFNKKNPEIIQIRIRFKLSPKMFEVILVSTSIQNEMGHQPTVFAEDRQHQILSEFWNISHNIWERINANTVPQPKEQPSFADLLEIG